MHIGIVGFGNVGSALFQGFEGLGSPIIIWNRTPQNIPDVIRHSSDVSVISSLPDLVAQSDIVLVAVTVEALTEVLPHVSKVGRSKPVVLLQAGNLSGAIVENADASELPYFRAIANINVTAKCGHTILLRSGDDTKLNKVKKLFECVGQVTFVATEDDLNRYSFVTGCFPALTAMFLEKLVKTAESLGLSYEIALRLSLEGLEKSAENMQYLSSTPSDYKRRVCSPGGELERSLEKLEHRFLTQLRLTDWAIPLHDSLAGKSKEDKADV